MRIIIVFSSTGFPEYDQVWQPLIDDTGYIPVNDSGDKIYAFDGKGHIKQYPGNYTDYLKKREAEKRNQAYDKNREDRAMSLLENKNGFITAEDLFLVLRDRYEGTEQYTKPVKFENWRDQSEGRKLPRTISSNLTQSSSIACLRSDMPIEVGAVMWYAMAVPQYSGYFPVYAGSTTIPKEFSNINSDNDPESAWWTFRMLQEAGDVQYDLAYITANNFWAANHANIVEVQKTVEKKVLALINKGKKKEAMELLNSFTYSQAESTLYHARRLLEIFQDLN